MKKMICKIVIGAGALLCVEPSYAVPETFISPDQITAAPFSITAPGLYVLTDDVAYTRFNGTAITISSSDVTLDLHGKSIINSAPGSETCISIAAALTNITIKNGTLRMFGGNGISVVAGCSDLNFENITAIGRATTAGNAFNFLGISGSATRTVGITITNCHVSNHLLGMLAFATDNVFIYNSTFNFNGLGGVVARDGNGWRLDACQASFNMAPVGLVVGVDAGNCGCWHIENSDFSANKAFLGPGRGIIFQAGITNSGGHEVENSTFCGNSGNVLSTIGLDFLNTNSSIIKNCAFNGNFSTTATAVGLRITGSAVLVENCEFDANFTLAGAGDAFGCEITSGTGQRIINCQAINNASFGGLGAGINITGTGHVIDHCVAGSNIGVGAPGSFGIRLLNGFHCLVKNCTAVANPTIGFQTSGSGAGDNLFIGNIAFGSTTNFAATIPFLTIAASGPYPAAPTFDERELANISFT